VRDGLKSGIRCPRWLSASESLNQKAQIGVYSTSRSRIRQRWISETRASCSCSSRQAFEEVSLSPSRLRISIGRTKVSGSSPLRKGLIELCSSMRRPLIICVAGWLSENPQQKQSHRLMDHVFWCQIGRQGVSDMIREVAIKVGLHDGASERWRII
jgi:hypothetical protein